MQISSVDMDKLTFRFMFQKSKFLLASALRMTQEIIMCAVLYPGTLSRERYLVYDGNVDFM